MSDSRRSSGAAAEARHRARRAALQMLYQWEVGRQPFSDVRETFWEHVPEDEAAGPADADVREFATRLAGGVVAHTGRIDALISQAAEHWRIERMNVLDRLVLRLATFELLEVPETPAPVVIDEALELGRAFSGDESVRFINGVLDAIRRTLGRA